MDIIVDIDGTLADLTHRLHFIRSPGMKKDWPAFFDACSGDKPIKPVIEMVHSLRVGLPTAARLVNRLIFCSGRPERTREATTAWLLNQNLIARLPANKDAHGHPLYMRKDDDFREDSIIKRELLDRIRADGFNPTLAIDDRKRVVDMWRS